jgi:hypothetical protein
MDIKDENMTQLLSELIKNIENSSHSLLHLMNLMTYIPKMSTSSDSSRDLCLSLLRSINQKLLTCDNNNNININLDIITSAISGLQNKESSYDEVKSLVKYFTNILRESNELFSVYNLCHVMKALNMMNPNDDEVKDLLRVITEKIQQMTSSQFDAVAISSIGSLSHMTTDIEEVRLLVNALTFHINDFKGFFASRHLVECLKGISHFNIIHPETRAIMYVFALKFRKYDGLPHEDRMIECFKSIASFGSGYSESRSLLATLSYLLHKSTRPYSPKYICELICCLTNYKVPNCSEIVDLTKEIGNKFEKVREQFLPNEILKILDCLGQLDVINDRNHRRLLVLFSSKILDQRHLPSYNETMDVVKKYWDGQARKDKEIKYLLTALTQHN